MKKVTDNKQTRSSSSETPGGSKKYWQSIEHFNEDPAFSNKAQNEFAEELPLGPDHTTRGSVAQQTNDFLSNPALGASSTSRRDFLKFLGFSVSAATLAACETPVTKAIPYVVKPEEITPGVPAYYASTYNDGVDYCSIVVKTREGRPILVEGNALSGVTKGGVSARVNSSVLSLYDSNRLKGPVANGSESDWGMIDDEIRTKLAEIVANGKNIVILSNSAIGPSTSEAIREFANKYSAAQKENTEQDKKSKAPKTGMETPVLPSSCKHVVYDAVSYSGLVKANEACFGTAVIPDYRFNKAKVIVSIGADFLVNWISSIEYASQYGEKRKPDGDWMSKHYQFETVLSTTGSNADVRGAIKPSEYGTVAVAIYNVLASKAGVAKLSGGNPGEENNVPSKIEEAANDLWANKGNCLVVSGSNDVADQTVVNGINHLLGNYGNTIDLSSPCNIRNGNDAEVENLVKEMNSGKVEALILYGGNPVYTMPSQLKFTEALAKVKLKISFADRLDETAKLCDYVCPDHHYLEAWNDANPKMGYYSLAQPVIRPLFNTRQAQSSLLKWAGLDPDFNKFIKGMWAKYGYQYFKDKYPTFDDYWNNSLRDGVAEIKRPVENMVIEFKGDVNAASAQIASSKGGNWELVLYAKTAIGEGNHGNNPWLHELPDPVTKVVWDNYITMNPSDMKSLGLNTHLAQEEKADMAKVTANGQEIVLPVVPVPGQRKGTLGIALGYGRTSVGKAGDNIGKNAYPFVSISNGTLSYFALDAAIEKTGETYAIASTQTHHTMMGRRIVLETDINSYKSIDPNDAHNGWNREVTVTSAYGEKLKAKDSNLWRDFNIDLGHRWGMTIDLNTCIGCGSCVTACHAENNVPVVGKDEVRKNRDMHWLRIDRYFSSDATKENNSYSEMEIPSDYPEVVFQPVMCQHCNHAPCETVCPVAATTHSEEGLNQMAYNRCVGTRYCANNCPYKVRRFNWFNYNGNADFKMVNPAQDDLARMVLNPDVVVRSRGVMEKCSLCVQRIQYGKLEAKKAGTPIEDGSIQTACASACPTHAITFGDYNSEKSMVRKEAGDKRSYHLLEEVGVQPNIWYLTKVKNVSTPITAHKDHSPEVQKAEDHHS